MEALLPAGRTVGVIGAGVMGQTILRGLIDRGLLAKESAWAVTKTGASGEKVAGALGIRVAQDYHALVADADILLLCVKPAQAEKVLATLRDAGLHPQTLIVSILAGVSIERLESLLGSGNPVVRAMPNTPCVVGEGMTVICGGRAATPEHLTLARHIFSPVGKCLTVEESYFDAITALSGSGPAYMYLILEALADAGVRVGLPRDLALTLVSQTMLGAARMVQQTGRHPAALRDDVTTPAGCTISGLLMLEDGKIRSVLARAVEEATRTVAQVGRAK